MEVEDKRKKAKGADEAKHRSKKTASGSGTASSGGVAEPEPAPAEVAEEEMLENPVDIVQHEDGSMSIVNKGEGDAQAHQAQGQAKPKERPLQGPIHIRDEPFYLVPKEQ